jgi:Resolvase, N terminal domain
VTRLDRLARSSRDLHNILHELAEIGADFVSLRETWCDTTTPAGRLMITVMGSPHTHPSLENFFGRAIETERVGPPDGGGWGASQRRPLSTAASHLQSRPTGFNGQRAARFPLKGG